MEQAGRSFEAFQKGIDTFPALSKTANPYRSLDAERVGALDGDQEGKKRKTLSSPPGNRRKERRGRGTSGHDDGDERRFMSQSMSETLMNRFPPTMKPLDRTLPEEREMVPRIQVANVSRGKVAVTLSQEPNSGSIVTT